MPALVETYQPDDAVHGVRVGVARGSLVDKFRLFNASLCEQDDG